MILDEIRGRIPHNLRMPVAASVVSISYFLSGKLALSLSFQPDYISALWPPNSIVLSALLLTPPRRWFWYVLAMVPAELAADLPSGISLQMALAFVGADCIEVFTAAFLLKTVCDGPLQLNNIKNVVLYALCAVITAPFISAFFGALVPALGETETEYIIRWRLWFMSDALTHLVLTPFIFLWLTLDTDKKNARTLSRTVEMIVLVSAIVIICFFAFRRGTKFIGYLPSLVYAPLPFLLWASARAGLRGIFTSSFFFTVIVIWRASRGYGPFATESPVNDVLHLQVFLFLVMSPLILLAAAVTEREKGESAVRESEKRFRLLADVAFDGIAITNRGVIVEANDAFARIFEYPPSEIIGLHVSKLVAPELRHSVMEKIKSGYEKPYESLCLKKDGSEFPAEVYGRNFSSDEGDLRITAIRDISHRRNAEIIHKRLNAELNAKNKELEQVLYVTSHDLRSPLVNIEGFSSEVEFSLKELLSVLDNNDIPQATKEKIIPVVTQHMPESLNYIHKSILKMDMLLKSLLNLSRMGRIELTIEDIDMNEMIATIISDSQFKLNASKVHIDISDLPQCRGDKVHISQLFSNLLDNAIKYLDPEKPGVIRISGNTERDNSIYCIEDNGIGISPEHKEKIFEIFCQLEPDRVAGEGLGLTIVQRIVDMHKGTVRVESEPGKGSKFFVSLPS